MFKAELFSRVFKLIPDESLLKPWFSLSSKVHSICPGSVVPQAHLIYAYLKKNYYTYYKYLEYLRKLPPFLIFGL
jgi:hypothetical protein